MAQRTKRKRKSVDEKTCLPAIVSKALFVYSALRVSIAAFHRLRRRYLRALLVDLCATFRSLDQVTYWIDFGSLLGIHRDGDLILYDNDIDIAVLTPSLFDLFPLLKEKLEPKYRVKGKDTLSPLLPDDVALRKVYFVGDAVIIPTQNRESAWLRVYCPLGMADLFRVMEIEGGLLYVDCGHRDATYMTKNSILPIVPVNWRGNVLPVPYDTESVLYHRYGPNWKIPMYMEKGRDLVEARKLYTRFFKCLGALGLRL